MPLLTVAIFSLEDFHLTPLVVDFSRTDLPRRMFSISEQEILTLLPDLTVMLQLAESLPDFAVIFAVPALLAVTTPSELTEATELSELLHVTFLIP